MIREIKNRSSQDSLIKEVPKLYYQTHSLSPGGTTIRLKEDKNVRAAKIMKVAMFKEALGKEAVSPLPERFMGINSMSGWVTVSLPSVINQNLLIKSLIEDTVKSRRVDGIKVQVCRETGLFRHDSHEMVVPPLADRIMGMNTVCDLTVFHIPSIVK